MLRPHFSTKRHDTTGSTSLASSAPWSSVHSSLAPIDCRRRAVLGRAILPAAAALKHMDDPADHAPVVLPLDTAHVGRQVRFNPTPLLIAQPKQVLAHDPDLQTNQSRMESGLPFRSSKINES